MYRMNFSLEVHSLVDIFTSWSLVVFHVSVIDRIHVHSMGQEDETDGEGGGVRLRKMPLKIRRTDYIRILSKL